jgi:hypothetical protein
MGSAGRPMDAVPEGVKTVRDLVAWEPSSGRPLPGQPPGWSLGNRPGGEQWTVSHRPAKVKRLPWLG